MLVPRVQSAQANKAITQISINIKKARHSVRAFFIIKLPKGLQIELLRIYSCVVFSIRLLANISAL